MGQAFQSPAVGMSQSQLSQSPCDSTWGQFIRKGCRIGWNRFTGQPFSQDRDVRRRGEVDMGKQDKT